ncbi:hypothetical protein HJC99_03260 [Candidatus Saccharibacteria bacterium]|nr:hypothetical protein [Candidatus Saccharibacteria bacterium]
MSAITGEAASVGQRVVSLDKSSEPHPALDLRTVSDALTGPIPTIKDGMAVPTSPPPPVIKPDPLDPDERRIAEDGGLGNWFALRRFVLLHPDRATREFPKSLKLSKEQIDKLMALRHARSAEEHQRRLLEQAEESRQREARQKVADFYNDVFMTGARIYALVQTPGIDPVILSANIKGTAAKTTLLLYVLAIIRLFGGKDTLLLPTTKNSATSTAGHDAGFDIYSEVLFTIGKLVKLLEDDPNPTNKKLWSFINTTPRIGLGVISGNPNSVINDHSELTVQTFNRMFDALYPNCHTMGLDTGNDDVNEDSIVLAGARKATVIIFNCKADVEITRLMLTSTMDAYRTDTEPPAEIAGQPGFVQTPKKVKKSIVVVNAIRVGEEIDFDQLTRTARQSAHAVPTDKFAGKCMTVPYDPYIASKRGTVCDPNAIDMQTFLAYMKVAEQALRISADTRGVDISHIDQVAETGTRYHPQLQAVNLYGELQSYPPPPERR